MTSTTPAARTPLKITPTPLTAALAGVVAAIAWPVVWSRFGGAESSLAFIVAILLVVALPAHAFVVGFGRSADTAARPLDRALLGRVGAWLAAAVGITLLRVAMGFQVT